jgi:hypothetical protein
MKFTYGKPRAMKRSSKRSFELHVKRSCNKSFVLHLKRTCKESLGHHVKRKIMKGVLGIQEKIGCKKTSNST